MSAVCAIEGCDRIARARGWCQLHYERWKRNRNPETVIQPHVRKIDEIEGVDMMRCGTCDTVKPVAAFTKSSYTANGYRARCKPCDREKNRAYAAENAERIKKRHRRNLLRRKYGLTEEQYDTMLAAQGGVCAICKSGDPQDSRLVGRDIFHVDHDHATGRVRGLLCALCNQGLGRFRDDRELLAEAILYLARHAE